MDKFDQIKFEWLLIVRELKKNSRVDIDKAKCTTVYLQFLRHNYFVYQELPSLAALVAAKVGSSYRDLVNGMLRYSLSKENQNKLLLNDLNRMGVNEEQLRLESAHPLVLSICAVTYYQVQHSSPAAILGLIYNIDYFYQTFGLSLLDGFEKGGISRHDMSFLCEKTIVDGDDEHLLRKIANQLLNTEQDNRAALYTAKCVSSILSQLMSIYNKDNLTKTSEITFSSFQVNERSERVNSIH